MTRLEEHPGLLRWAQKPLGKLVLLVVFGWFFQSVYSANQVLGRNSWPQIMAAVTVSALAGRYRRQALAVTTLALLCLAPDWFPSVWLNKLCQRENLPEEVLNMLRPLALAGTGALTIGLVVARRKLPHSWLARWPVLTLLAGYFGLVALACSPWLSGGARVFCFSWVWALSAYLWYIAYALRDARSQPGSPLWFQLASFHPFFSGTSIPIGLGAANLRQREARNSEELAVTQWKALKLVIWCWLMAQLEQIMIGWRGELGLLDIQVLIRQQLDGTAFYSRSTCWASLLYSFFESIVGALALGNLLVACARMGGFRLLQQTYKPLAARSVADYWNRISYYYKQLVVELFFFPCYLTCAKRYPRLRQALAIFMAAGVGNLLYHFRSLLPLVARHGLMQTLWGMRTYACYCLILCSGLWLSQLRSASSTASPGLFQRLLTFTRIVLFFSLLSLFDQLYTPHSPSQRLAFLGYLCGL